MKARSLSSFFILHSPFNITSATELIPLEVCEPISGLTPGTYYHYRAIATNTMGAATSSDGTFRTAWPTARYVDAASTNASPPYTDWTTAATNIQDAVNAPDADTVPGTWVLATTGAYAPVTVPRPAFLRSVNGPEFTTIIGGGAARCVELADGDGMNNSLATNLPGQPCTITFTDTNDVGPPPCYHRVGAANP